MMNADFEMIIDTEPKKEELVPHIEGPPLPSKPRRKTIRRRRGSTQTIELKVLLQGVTGGGEARILEYLNKHNTHAFTAKWIAKITGLKTGSTSVFLSRLRSKGLVKTHKSYWFATKAKVQA